jgi:signal transduction histidine kinase
VAENVIPVRHLSWPASRRVVSVALVPLLVAVLLLSVIVPALEMRRVTRLLQEITEVIEPTQAVSWKLEQVAGHERRSLFINAALVMIALAAIGEVVSLSRRERRLTAVLRNRVAEESAIANERVRLLDEAREGRQALERVMKSRQRLLRGFSHDVKNPLGAADGYAELLSAGIYGELAPKQMETVERIRRSIRRALDLIDDLHELARVETGHIALHRDAVDIGELVRASADEYRGAASAAGLPLTVDVAEDLPLVETDGVRVSQIVGNLLSNAIKYTKTGEVTLRARRYSPATIPHTPASVNIEVIDTGRGIPAESQEQIFEEFSRLGTSDRPGAGLGLAISQRLAEALRGEITVQSEPGRGSTFTLRIPVTIPDEPSTAPEWQLVEQLHPDRALPLPAARANLHDAGSTSVAPLSTIASLS